MPETYLMRVRQLIEDQYPMSFGEALCHEIHTNGTTFLWLAEKWGISVTALGELIYDHCKRLEQDPNKAIEAPTLNDISVPTETSLSEEGVMNDEESIQ